MKQVFIIFLFSFIHFSGYTQRSGSAVIDTNIIKKKDTLTRIQPDSNFKKNDTLPKKDTALSTLTIYKNDLAKNLKLNSFLNSDAKPEAMYNKIKSHLKNDDKYFYLLIFIAALFGFFRFFYTKYFNNLFRVFFNASLRQNQLTDQLIQAKLPSLLFNLLFIVIGGIYIYLLLNYYSLMPNHNYWLVVSYCMISLGLIYLIKFITLKFTGWLTGYNQIINTYIFIIFLINKIIGVILIPFSILIAFAMPSLATASVIISLLLIGLMFLLRFFRSYGLLQNQLKVSRFHFFMYLIGIEILPVLLIYKGLVLLLTKYI